MRLVRKFENDEMRGIKAEAAKKGVNVVFFLGEIRAMKGGKKIAARGEYSADGKTFYIALDDPDFTARQIYDHEDFHERSHSDAELQEAAENIINSHSAAELREMVQAYVNAYGWTDMSNEDILQEILADAYAGIDIFLGRDYYEGATRFTEDVRGAVKAREGEQQTERGPPAEAKQSEIMEDADNERYNKENDAGRVRSGLVENHALDAGHSERARSKGDPGRSVRGASQKGSGRAVRYENLTQSEKDFAHTLLFDPLDASERYRDFYRDYSVTDLDEYLYTAFSENTPEFQALCRLIPEFKNGADTLLAYLNGEEAEEGYIQRTDNTGLTLSDAQYEFFKDSKVKDAQGHLKVMYRGGNTDIEVFDRKLFNKVNGTKYDGIIVPTETVTFSSEQSKKISNMTPTSNPNVNFSQKLTAEDELRRQNETLQKRVEYWKGQTKRTAVPTARADDAEKVARQVVKDYDSEADAKEIGAALKALTDYIMRGENITYAEVKDRAVEIAREVVENAKALRDGDGETFREVRDALHKPLIISAKDANDVTPDGWGDYRNSIRSKVNISINGKGTPIDTAYAELSDRFPSLFPEEITHPADQLQHMVDVIDELTPVYENPFSYNKALEICFRLSYDAPCA